MYIAVGYDAQGRCLPCPWSGRDRHGSPHIAAVAIDRLEPPEWFRFREWPDTYDCFFNQPSQPELDAEQPAAREHLIAAAVQWLRQGCDGFRLDYAHGLSRSFWSRFRAATRAVAPESICLGEITHTPPVVRSYAGRLDGCLDFALCELLRNSFGRGDLTLSEFDRHLHRHLMYFKDRLVLPSFLDNHDMNRFLLLAGGDRRRLKLAALVQFLLPGPPVVYYGTEIGLSQRRPVGPLEEARLPMPKSGDWDDELRSFYRDLIRLRQQCEPYHAHPVLLWVDDTVQSAAWRIGSAELVVNLGPESMVPVQGRRVLLATDPAVTQVMAIDTSAATATVLRPWCLTAA